MTQKQPAPVLYSAYNFQFMFSIYSELLLEQGLPTPKAPAEGKCPMIMYRNNGKYAGTVSCGEARILQDEGSSVSLHIPKNSRGVYKTRVYRTRVYNDCSDFIHIIPKNECLIGPIVEVVQNNSDVEDSKLVHILKIPHTVTNKSEWGKVWVRRFKNQDDSPSENLQRRENIGGNTPYYIIDEQFITIFTTEFSLFTCTACKHSCYGTAIIIILGELISSQQTRKSSLKIKTFLCTDLYRIPDFKNVSINIS